MDSIGKRSGIWGTCSEEEESACRSLTSASLHENSEASRELTGTTGTLSCFAIASKKKGDLREGLGVNREGSRGECLRFRIVLIM